LLKVGLQAVPDAQLFGQVVLRRYAGRLKANQQANRRSPSVVHGTWRSLAAHLLWEQGVAGSNPAVPTTNTNALLSRGADGPSLG
jgi:hypothetical protein